MNAATGTTKQWYIS